MSSYEYKEILLFVHNNILPYFLFQYSIYSGEAFVGHSFDAFGVNLATPHEEKNSTQAKLKSASKILTFNDRKLYNNMFYWQ